MTKIILLITFLLATGQTVLTVRDKVPKVGIIGGGIGGTSCAYFIKSLFGVSGVSIDLFEADKIGGRLSVVNLNEKSYEEGGSIIHQRNKYLSSFLKKCNLSKRPATDGHFALYDGKNYVFSESQWVLKTLWNIFHRYGLGIWKLKNQIESMLTAFERIYDLQEVGEAFETVGALLAAMDSKFTEYLNTTSESGFRKRGISDTVIDEIIMATILTNYGQNLQVHEMVGSVSVAGGFGDLWSVRGGNYKIPECLLNSSDANFIPELVTRVKKLSTGQIEIRSEAAGQMSHRDDVERPEVSFKRTYDAVILAVPQSPDSKRKILFEGFDGGLEFVGRYHKTVCTLIEGRLSQKYFPSGSPWIDEILAVKEDLLFNSVGRISTVDGFSRNSNESGVWKIFSRNPLKDDEINSLFSEISGKHVREWLAYPHYQSVRFPGHKSFVLAPNVYHVNAIEWAASAMEMSVIGAKNVALLLHKNIKSGKDDDDRRVLPGKIEL